jgi:hypothetical protein
MCSSGPEITTDIDTRHGKTLESFDGVMSFSTQKPLA